MAQNRTQIILASGSPRRAELFEMLGLSFDVVASAIDESPFPGERPAEYVARLAREKVDDVARRCSPGLIIGADTAVVLGARIMGKPIDAADARLMLASLSGQWHEVMTGVALLDSGRGARCEGIEITRVRFTTISAEEIDWYVGTGEPLDKAGAYAIQGRGGLFVAAIEGNYHNVVGLPLPLLQTMVARLGYSLIATREGKGSTCELD